MNEYSVPKPAPEDSITHIEQCFWSMHKASRETPASTAAERKALLRALSDVISKHAREFSETIARDFGWRSHDETRMAEVVPALTLIRNAVANLDRWMRPEARETSHPVLAGAQPCLLAAQGRRAHHIALELSPAAHGRCVGSSAPRATASSSSRPKRRQPRPLRSSARLKMRWDPIG